MSENQIRFDDGAAYERMMGVWSRLVGEAFLDWLAPEAGQSWIDVGCGNGAFTELLAQRCAPVRIVGIDPSEGQLAYARSRPVGQMARFERGDAMALPAADGAFDAAVMALVIFFVPEPARGLAEMKRVVKPGGLICAYVWDVLSPGGFPLYPMQAELRTLGFTPMLPPRADVSPMPALRALWEDAGLEQVRTREITVARTFEDFDDVWASAKIALGMTPATRELSAESRSGLRERLRVRLPEDADGRVTFSARANAVTGRALG